MKILQSHIYACARMDSLATGNLVKVRKALSVVINPTQSQFRSS